MRYSLKFVESALKELRKPAPAFAANSRKRCSNACNTGTFHQQACMACQAASRSSCAGYRMVYQVNDKVVVVSVIAVRKREKDLVYRLAEKQS